jgi:hypothetical protein
MTGSGVPKIFGKVVIFLIIQKTAFGEKLT